MIGANRMRARQFPRLAGVPVESVASTGLPSTGGVPFSDRISE
jgi:hypothetical protein